jgi:uncharacterized protein involved in exopolysaccharide biosynthesis
MENNPTFIPQEENTNILAQLMRYAKHWYWLVFGAFLGLFVAYMYLRYTPTQYGITSSIMIKEDRTKSQNIGDAIFGELGISAGKTSNIEDEIYLFNSKTLLEKTVQRLGLQVQYKVKGRLINSHIYKKLPIKLQLLDSIHQINKRQEIEIKLLNEKTFELELEGQKKVISFGETFVTENGKFRLIYQPNIKDFNTSEFIISLSPINKVASSFKNALNLSIPKIRSNI